MNNDRYLLMPVKACSTSLLRTTKTTTLYPHKSEKLAEDFFIILPRRNIQYSRLHYVAKSSDRVLERGKGGEERWRVVKKEGKTDRKKLKRVEKGKEVCRGPVLHANYFHEAPWLDHAGGTALDLT